MDGWDEQIPPLEVMSADIDVGYMSTPDKLCVVLSPNQSFCCDGCDSGVNVFAWWHHVVFNPIDTHRRTSQFWFALNNKTWQCYNAAWTLDNRKDKEPGLRALIQPIAKMNCWNKGNLFTHYSDASLVYLSLYDTRKRTVSNCRVYSSICWPHVIHEIWGNKDDS